jgi:ParB family chromosome partitioning protein
VRRVKDGVPLAELAESIARRGLIQSLHVRPVLDAEGAETGLFEVPAGGRRFRALELLVKQKRLAKTAPVPCIVGDAASDILADEISLAENIDRAPLHPVDQFRAFAAMRANGMTEEAIAAAFLVGVHVVKQRLRLTAVAPALIDLYAEDAMTLEQLMAFTVTQDHARQIQVWQAIKDKWQKSPYQIRRMLTEGAVNASDKRAVFVGVETYEAAGGTVMRDLFEADQGGWLEDTALLDRLSAEKLKAATREIATEGWKWVEAGVTLPYGYQQGLRRLTGTAPALTEEERAASEALQIEHEGLETEYAAYDELPDEVDARLAALEYALAAFERPIRFEPTDIARAGAFVTIGGDGSLVVDRGYVCPEDEPSVAEDSPPSAEADIPNDHVTIAAPRPIVAAADPPVAADEEEDNGIKPLPERLLLELTAYRTVALRNAVALHPDIAMTLLLHKLVRDAFALRHAAPAGCLEANIRHIVFPIQGDELQDSPAARDIASRHDAWRVQLPADDQDLWDWLTGLDDANRAALLAHCVSFGVTALVERPDPYGGTGLSQHGLDMRLAQADRLARLTQLDLAAAGWRPTVDNYLGRVTKARILEAVREGVGEGAAQLIGHLKKPDMAREAEGLLADSVWLPEPLRVSGQDRSENRAGDDEGRPDRDDAAPNAIAAE